MRLYIRFFLLSLFLAISFLPKILLAEELRVPVALQPWLDWVRDRHPELTCATQGTERPCVWPGRLALALEQKQGSFTYSVVVERKGNVLLPGGKTSWPVQLAAMSQGRESSVRVMNRDGRPVAYLTAGEYELKGRFYWDSLPETLDVPVTTGLIQLSIDGKQISQPKIGPEGGLWLRRMTGADETERDTLAISVARRLGDGVPFRVDTRMVLRISGRAREIQLGNPLLAKSRTVSISSPLSYRLDADQNLIVQGKPGEHEIMLESVLDSPPPSMSGISSPVAEWPTQETWVWAPDEQFRSVQLSGPTEVDPDRAELPDEWSSLSAYLIEPTTVLNFEELRRGESNLPPNQLALTRKIWLDLDGHGATVQDQFTGTVSQGWRLNTLSGMNVGHVSVNGQDALITTDSSSGGSGPMGVEVRNQSLNLVADSRLAEIKSFSAVGWDHDVTSLNLQLYLPPGWTLFDASGVDNLSSSWLSSWTLLDVFIVLLIAGATSRLLGRFWGAIALGALVLGHHVPHAPLLIWIHLLVCVALIRGVPVSSDFRRWVYAYYIATLGMLLLHVIPFSIAQVRSGIYPQLGEGTVSFGGFDVLYGVLGGGLATILIIGASCASLVYLFKAQWKKLMLSVGIIFGVVILIVLSSSLFAPQVLFNANMNRQFQSVGGEVASFDMPASPPQPLDYNAPVEQEEAYSSGSLSVYRSESVPAKRERFAKLKQQLTAIDPHAVIQTGPGVPTWFWKQWSLYWSGPVQRDQIVTLHLLGPNTNLVLALCRVLLFGLLAYGFIVRRASKGGLAAVLLLFASVLAPQRASADEFPSAELLGELERRVLENQCQGDCVSVGKFKISIVGEELAITAEVSGSGNTSWPLPGPHQQFAPTSVRLDGQEALALRQDSSGTLWVRIPDGAHTITAKGDIGKRSVVTLSFASIPGNVQVEASGWLIDGVSPTGRIQSSVQLTRVEKSETVSADAPAADVVLPPWYLVRREFRIDLPWTIETTVTRLGSVERSGIAKIPLVPGESVTTDEVTVQGGVATVNFPRDVASVSWTGALKEEPEIALMAPVEQSISETWVVACSAMWRCEPEGITAVSSVDGGQFISSWQPWPGEALKLSVSKPRGVEGSSTTVDSSILTFRPGARMLEADLQLGVRASRGGFVKVLLPPGAQVSATTVDGQPKTLHPQGQDLLLPVEAGARQFSVKWQQNWESTLFSSMPAVSIEGGVFNVTSIVELPENRWILFAFGPSWGPAVLFWSKLLIVVLMSFIFGRVRFSPLKSFEWLLLLLGLATLPSAAIALPVLWFAAISYREKHQILQRWQFNVLQLIIVALTVASVVVLYQAVQQGLLFYPDMQIQGNGSSNTQLRWYVDSVRGEFPAVSIFTAPILAWRGIMLLWSFWLVWSLLRWVEWGWRAFRSGGTMWRGKGETPVANSSAAE